MYLTVIRLYWTHDMESKKKTSSYSMMQSQYEYARDHMEQSKLSTSLEREHISSGVDSTQWPQAWTKAWYVRIAEFFLRYALFGAFFYFMVQEYKQLGGGQNAWGVQPGEFEFKKSEDIKERLDDVKGIDEIKDEINNLIRMINDPEAYHSKGAKMHKGVLLHGNPGTGKTMLSRAIAGEAGVSFLYCTGSSFDEMFVGVGAKRVRELF